MEREDDDELEECDEVANDDCLIIGVDDGVSLRIGNEDVVGIDDGDDDSEDDGNDGAFLRIGDDQGGE